MILIVTFILLAIAAFGKAVSDALMSTLKSDFSKSYFARFKNEKFWNPTISHRNKWKNGDKRQGEAFLGSSTFFVAFTCAWHWFNSLTYWSFFAALSLHVSKFYFENPLADYVFRLLILKNLFTGVFQLIYSNLKK